MHKTIHFNAVCLKRRGWFYLTNVLKDVSDYRFRDVAVTNIDIVIKVEGSLAAHMFSFDLSDDMIHGLVWFN